MIRRCAAIVLSFYPLITTAQSGAASGTQRSAPTFDGYRRSSQYLTHARRRTTRRRYSAPNEER